MDTKEAYPDPTGQGIELSSRQPYQELHAPGIEVMESSNLEVVAPQPWEKASGLPETSPYTYYPSSTPPFGSVVAPTYDYHHHTPFDQRAALMPPAAPPPPVGPETARILGLKRQTFYIIVAIAVFLTVIAVAVGVGVGVATRNSSGSSVPA